MDLRYITYFTLLLISTLLYPSPSTLLAQSLSFGYIYNTSSNENFDYLQKVLPNSFASSFRSRYKQYKIKKPADIEDVLKQFQKTDGNRYAEEKFPELADKSDTDFFIAGHFIPLPDNKIELHIMVYNHDQMELFYFTDTGTIETEMFSLIDRVTKIISQMIRDDYFYKNTRIEPRAKLAFITNLSGSELNEWYYQFLKQKYVISSIQGADLSPVYTQTMIYNQLQYLYSSEIGYNRIRSEKKHIVEYSSWQSNTYVKKNKIVKEMLTKYYYDFPENQKKVFRDLAYAHKKSIDYLFIIGFNKDHDKAWLRCIDLKREKIIWYEGKITDKGKLNSPLQNIAVNIIKKFLKTN